MTGGDSSKSQIPRFPEKISLKCCKYKFADNSLQEILAKSFSIFDLVRPPRTRRYLHKNKNIQLDESAKNKIKPGMILNVVLFLPRDQKMDGSIRP
jgi:hypothetical protein